MEVPTDDGVFSQKFGAPALLKCKADVIAADAPPFSLRSLAPRPQVAQA